MGDSRHESTGTFTVTVEEHIERLTNTLKSRAPVTVRKYELIADGDKVAVVGTARSNDRIVNWVQVFRLENGKIAETWWLGNVRGVEW